MIVEFLQKVDSTNSYAQKFVTRKQNAIVRAEIQTNGKGTKGRTFISEKGGLYLTKVKFYEFLPAEQAFSVMINSAMAVVSTLLAYGINAGIKWPNDIIVNGKKICGILITNRFCGDLVEHSIIGIGLNVNNEISPEICDIATSISKVLGKQVDENGVFFTLMQNLEQQFSVEEYKKASLLFGKKVTVIRGENTFDTVVKDLLPDGRLLLENGEILSAGEIDLKILFSLGSVTTNN